MASRVGDLKARGVAAISEGGVNCYLVQAEDRFVLIDTGFAKHRRAVELALERAGCRPGDLALILITHADADHVGNAAYLRDRFAAPIGLHPNEAVAAAGGDMMATRGALHPFKRAVAGVLMPLFRLRKADRFEPDIELADGADLAAYGLNGCVLHLGGHSSGSLAVLMDDGTLFCGDVLENRRRPQPATLVDDRTALATAVERLRTLEVDVVCPGHGAPFRMTDLDTAGG